MSNLCNSNKQINKYFLQFYFYHFSCFLYFAKLLVLYSLPHDVNHRVTVVKQAEKALIVPPISADKVNISTDSFENIRSQKRNLVNNSRGVAGKIDHGYEKISVTKQTS